MRRQLLATNGVLGFSMLAEPRRKHATQRCPCRRDEAALNAFAVAQPHHQLMKVLAPEMDATRFVRWTITGADGVPSWTQALERLKCRRQPFPTLALEHPMTDVRSKVVTPPERTATMTSATPPVIPGTPVLVGSRGVDVMGSRTHRFRSA